MNKSRPRGARVFAVNVANLPEGTIVEPEAADEEDAERPGAAASGEGVRAADEEAVRAMAADGRWTDVVQVSSDVFTGTGLTPPTSAPGLGLPLPRRRRPGASAIGSCVQILGPSVTSERLAKLRVRTWRQPGTSRCRIDGRPGFPVRWRMCDRTVGAHGLRLVVHAGSSESERRTVDACKRTRTHTRTHTPAHASAHTHVHAHAR